MEKPLAQVRTYVYMELFGGRPAPTPATIAKHIGTTPQGAANALQRLQDDYDALVLVPGTSYIWMAEPFSALPTDYPVHDHSKTWYGNCIWDALGIAALVGGTVSIPAVCPHTGTPLTLETGPNGLVKDPGVAHFSVPASRWWESIGFT